MVQVILAFIASDRYYTEAYVGYLYALAIFLLAMLSSWGVAFFFQRVGGIGMAVRATLTCAIYRKSLRLNATARREFDMGKVINMVSTDCVRIDLFITFFHLLWSYGIQLPVIVALLIHLIG